MSLTLRTGLGQPVLGHGNLVLTGVHEDLGVTHPRERRGLLWHNHGELQLLVEPVKVEQEASLELMLEDNRLLECKPDLVVWMDEEQFLHIEGMKVSVELEFSLCEGLLLVLSLKNIIDIEFLL